MNDSDPTRSTSPQVRTVVVAIAPDVVSEDDTEPFSRRHDARFEDVPPTLRCVELEVVSYIREVAVNPQNEVD